MKTSEKICPSIRSLESPIEQADEFSRCPPLILTSNFSSTHRFQPARALPFLIGSALISSLSLVALLAYLFIQSPAPEQSSLPQRDSIRQ